jgi:fumarate hydratase class II
MRISTRILRNNLPKRYFGTRKEKDSFGYIEVDEDRLWGAQTQRSLQNFKIGKEKMPHGKIDFA